MLQYLIILLDDSCVSFCRYKNDKVERNLMPLEILRDGIVFGMKENLQIQFVLPDYQLPVEYWQEMMSVDHSIIVSGEVDYEELVPKNIFYQLPDVIVFNSIGKYIDYSHKTNQTYVLRIDKSVFFDNQKIIAESFFTVSRLNIIITDIQTFSDNDFEQYKTCLSFLSERIKNAYLKGLCPQVNLLTDRLMLNGMNNCNAGVSNITLAPDGRFYICPAFYQAVCTSPNCDDFAIGSLSDGVNIKNSNLLKIESAPLCRNCDAFQCNRCVWLNKETTYEVNTPSHEQCVMAHLERNASRKLLNELRSGNPSFMDGIEISEIDYLDPFDVKQEL